MVFTTFNSNANTKYFFFLIVTSLAVKLNDMINDAGLSLEEIIQDLDVEIRYAGKVFA